MKKNLFPKTLLMSLTLGATLPVLAASLQGSSLQKVQGENQTMKTGVYYIVNDKRVSGTDLHVYVNGTKLWANKFSTEPATHTDVFIFHSKGDGKYTIQSLRNGQYVQTASDNNVVYSTGTSPYQFSVIYQEKSKGTGKSYFNIYNEKDKSDWCWHLDANKHVVRWHPLQSDGNTGSICPSEFRLDEVTTMTTDSIRALLANKTGAVDPTLDTTMYYQIVSEPYSISMRDDYVNGHLSTETFDKDDYLFYWKLIKLSNGRYAFRNAITGKYILNQNGATSKFYTTTTEIGNGFKVKQNLSDPYLLLFEMYDSDNVGIHCPESQGYNPVGWTVGSEANKWLFKVATLDTAKFKTQQAAYAERVDLTTNASTYASLIKTYFTDEACTTVTDEVRNMTDDDLKAKMTAAKLAPELQNVVLKMKDQSWQSYTSGTNWEKKYRIADYNVYSEYNYNNWAQAMGLGNNFGDLTNPTGVTAKDGDNIFIFVGDDIPDGATLGAQLVPLGSRTGNNYELKKGLNIILNRGEKSIFINYIGYTYNKNKKLSDFKPLNIHIEGGKVNGYFDVTKGDTDDDWMKMQDDGLVWAKAFQMKDTMIVMHMPGADVKQYTPVKLFELTELWNSIVSREEYLMGFRGAQKEKCNNLLNATAVDHGYMYASTSGTYYNYNTLGTVLNYDAMNKGDGSLWGPAHEFGHNHQQLINMAGMTEISNNVFSNMILFTSGHVTSRAELCTYTDVDGKKYEGVPESKIQTFADKYAAKKYWFEYGTWGTTQMYYKLYLMFHAAGNDTTFFNKWFHYLRRNKMKNRNTDHCTGPDDYLNFALACCDAAKQDLSSFFQSWGFFYDVKDVVIGDYSNTTMNTTRAQWQAALAKMHTYPKGPGNNMIFIDDHIRKTPATYPGHAAGESRADYNNNVKVGSMGDFGSWDQFCPDSLGQGWANQVSMKTDAQGKRTYTFVPMNNHVVGFKIYSSGDALIYFANTKTFTIPAAVMKKANNDVKVKVCGSDGSEVDPGVAPPTDIRKVAVTGNGKVNVYTISGILIREGVDAATATDGLMRGVYLVNRKKIVIN